MLKSLITLDEFVRRMYLRGEYDNYKDLIEALFMMKVNLLIMLSWENYLRNTKFKRTSIMT